jgi:hypothetical protein
VNILDKRFKYTPVSEMGPDYLKNRFQQIREEQQKSAAQAKLRSVINMKKGIR